MSRTLFLLLVVGVVCISAKECSDSSPGCSSGGAFSYSTGGDSSASSGDDSSGSSTGGSVVAKRAAEDYFDQIAEESSPVSSGSTGSSGGDHAWAFPTVNINRDTDGTTIEVNLQTGAGEDLGGGEGTSTWNRNKTLASGQRDSLYDNLLTQDTLYDGVISQANKHVNNYIMSDAYNHVVAAEKPTLEDNFLEPFQFEESNVHGDFTVGGDKVKVVVVIVAIWYLLIAILAQSSFLYGGSFSKCDGSPGVDPELVNHIFASADHPIFAPHEDSSMQKSLLDMFEVIEDSSEEGYPGGLPDLSEVSTMCSKNAFFYGMNGNHMRAVEMVKNMLMQQGSASEMMSMAKAFRHHSDMNPKVWYEALVKACMEREDMAGMHMPGPLDAMPDTFIAEMAFQQDDYRSLTRVKRQAFLRGDGDDAYYEGGYNAKAKGGKKKKGSKKKKGKKEKKCFKVNGSIGKDNGVENLLWYFREDLMVNSHHWYWHLTFPMMNRVKRDRRGELFYFAHKSMITRYNIERLCNGLEFTVPLRLTPGGTIHEGYSAHLTDHNSAKKWTDRPPHIPVSDILHNENPDPRQTIIIRDWLEIENRLFKAIDSGYFVSPRGKVKIPKYEGIDILGNTVEAVDLSINPRYYDPEGYHNNGHQILAFAVDPNYHLMLAPGPMGDPATAMRDPIFYRWHFYVNQIFERYKRTLKAYQPVGGDFPLLWDGVYVAEVGILGSKKGQHNELKTYWNERKVDLSLGLAFDRNKTYFEEHDHHESLKVCATHLDHEEFEYEIVVDRKPCAISKSNAATVRIFIAPRYDLKGRRFTMKEQRHLFVHLDLFKVKLGVGRTVIKRRSIDSTLTIPWSKSLRQLQSELEANPSPPSCGCGWPHHLLLPKGTHEGTPFDLFVMVTNGDEDIVDEPNKNPFGGCESAPIYCGIPNKKYPDRRPMGYPFDRELYASPSDCPPGHSIWAKVCPLVSYHWKSPLFLEDYMRGIHNMATTKVVITHKD